MTDELFEIVHNIPSPYRLHLFRLLGAELQRRGLRLKVHFLASGHADRQHWAVGDQPLGFEHVTWPDHPVTIRRKEWHLNPALLGHLLSGRREVLMVGGPWDSFTGMAASLVGRARLRIAWFEGNTSTPGRVTGFAQSMKRVLLRRYHRFAVPGREGIAFARLVFGPDADRRATVLPNIVDEARFRRPDERAAAFRTELGLLPGEKLAVWPARLIRVKGVPEFLSHLEPRDLQGWRLAIFGEGPLEGTVRELCLKRGLADRVLLRRSIPYDRMPAMYQAASLFVLPSLNDQNPLSVVEAMHSGLPILVSRRIGNFPEALGNGSNGWSFEPTDAAAVRESISAAFGCADAELRTRGETSRTRAAEHWDSRAAVARFVASVLPEA